MEVSGQLHVPGDLPQGNRLWYPLDKKLGGPQSQSGRCGQEKNLASAGNRTPAVQPVAIPSEPKTLPEINIKATFRFILLDF
jgi:hypothetical protein